MPIPIKPTVLEALGSSFVREEGLGNFRSALLLAGDHLNRATNPLEKSKAWLTLGAVHLMRGQIKLAGKCWKNASTGAEQDEGLEVLLAAFRHLAEYESFNTKLDGAAAEAVEILARWNIAAVMAEQIPALTALREKCRDQEVQNLAWFLGEVIGVGKNVRSLADRWEALSLSEDQGKLLWNFLDSMEKTGQTALSRNLKDYAFFPLWMRAELLQRANFPDQASLALEAAENMADILQDDARKAQCLLSRGDWLTAPFSTALAWDLALADSTTENSILAGTIESREFKPIDSDTIKQAAGLYQKAAILFEAAGAKRGIAQTHLRMAYLEFRSGQSEQSEPLLRQAESLFRETEDFRGLMLCRTYQLMIGLWQREWNDLPHRAAVIGRWGRWTGDFSFIHSLGILLNRFARHLFLRHGRYEAARMAYRAAQALFEALQAPINATQNMVDRALLNEAVGDFTGAGAEIKNAADRYMELALRPPGFWSQPQAVNSILIQHAVMLASQGFNISNGLMDGKQMAHFQQQLATFVKQLNPQGTIPQTAPQDLEEMRVFSLTYLALDLQNKARILIPFYQFKKADQSGNQPAARQHWKEAFQALDQQEEPTALFYQAILWGAKRDYHQASESFHQYLKVRSTSLPEIITGNPGSGITINQEELKQLQHRYYWEQAFSMWVQLEQFAEAEKSWRKRVELENEHWWEQDNAPWRIGSSLAEMYEGLEQYELALHYCRRSMEMLEQRRKELSRDELKTAIANDRGAQFLYHQAARLAFQRGDPEDAFNYIEQGKARALLDLLSAHPNRLPLKKQQHAKVQAWRESNAKLQALQGLLAAERRKGQAEPERTKQLEEEIARELKHLEGLEDRLVEEVPSFFSTVGGSARSLSIPELQGYLEENQLCISYSYYEKDLFIWAIDKNGLAGSSWQRLPVRELSHLALDLHRSCQEKLSFLESADRLAELLLDPVADCVDNHRQIYFAPSGSLYLVPFHALQIRGTPLAETHTISFIPSASTIQYFSPVDLKKNSKLLAVGNPTGDLNAAAVEAGFVANLFPSKVLIGEKATEAAVRKALPRADILHLATHGKLSEEAPLASALALADGAEITLYELMGMQLKAELVVLSACETGKGATTNGDDVVGLTRGLLAAGAKAAIVSFWSVDDVSTSLMMQHFYQGLKEGRSPVQALSEAQKFLRNTSRKTLHRDLRQGMQKLEPEQQRSLRGIKLDRDSETSQGYEHPFYWAPFFFVGRF